MRDLLALCVIGSIAAGAYADGVCRLPFTTGPDPEPGTVSYAGTDVFGTGEFSFSVSDDTDEPAITVRDVAPGGAFVTASVRDTRLSCAARRVPTLFGVSSANAYAYVQAERPLRLLATWDLVGIGAAVALPVEGGETIDGVLLQGRKAGSMVFTLPPGSYRLYTEVAVLSPPGGDPESSISLELVRPCDVDADLALTLDDVDAFVQGFLGDDLAVVDCDGSGALNFDDIDCFVGCFLDTCE